jgi:NitT/TauT family transport system substrate-binding protein
MGRNMLKKLAIPLCLLLLAALVMAGCGEKAAPTASAEPVNLKIGALPRIFDLVIYAAQQDGVFTQNNLKVDIVPFASVLERNNAFLAGQLDGFADSIYEAINMNKEGQNAEVAGHNLMPDMFKIVVAPGSGIINPSQLKGKQIATSTGTIMDYALDQLLAPYKMSSADLTLVNVPKMPLRLDMLAQGTVQSAIFTPPLSEQAIASGNTLILSDSSKMLAGPALIFNINAVNNKNAAIKNFTKAWNQEIALINTSPEKYRDLLVKTAQVPTALAASYKIPTFPEVRKPTQSEVSLMGDWMKSKGLLTNAVNYDTLVMK